MQSEEEISALVARAKALHKTGLSLRKTAEQLATEGVPAPAHRWKKWHHSAVRWCLDPPPVSPPPSRPPSAPGPAPARPTIEVYGPFTAADRRLWRALVQRAEADLGSLDSHKLSASYLLDILGLDQEQLSAALDRLTCTSIKWVGHDRAALTVRTALIASATQSGDLMSFHLPPHLVKLLREPKYNAHIQMVLEDNAGQ